MKRTAEALDWIVTLLKSQGSQFRISGGLAARLYGSTRPLSDIDIEVKDSDLLDLRKKVYRQITYGPDRYKDDEFDLLLMTLNYKGQEIDICGTSSIRLFDKRDNTWKKWHVDLNRTQRKTLYGIILPVIPLDELIDYKSMIRRDVDIKDILYLSRVNP